MKATQKLQDLGQKLWLDNITRGVVRNGKLRSRASIKQEEGDGDDDPNEHWAFFCAMPRIVALRLEQS